MGTEVTRDLCCLKGNAVTLTPEGYKGIKATAHRNMAFP